MEKKFTRDLLIELRSKMNGAIRNVASQYGLIIDFVSAQFDDTSAAFRAEIKFAATDGYDPGKANWDIYCQAFKFEPEDYGKVFSFPGEVTKYQIIGINPRARDNPVIICRIPDRKEYVAPHQDVRFALERELVTRLPAITYGVKAALRDPTPHQRKIEWDLNCWRWEMEPEDFGKEYTLNNGITYRIIGCNPHYIKNTILVLNLKSKKEYTISPMEVKDFLTQENVAIEE